ncbi:DUF3560 domain-containing protein [Chitinophaga silvisoli]|uniref:DUF3560 domain-containing protein n=1 Tax=Chitinophaga silvisoli TaxID=2291814 RepID=A0A3E1P2S2_9BACT|nr:DUF3560 domain-containing protein [Chitinophaga silvisoli]RFM34414.1 DUF3560 domain-containing protein [Chitinophaga silvisoli]
MKHNFEQRKQNRIENAKAQAEKNSLLSDRQYSAAQEIASYIPMGQPILVGHHSEKRHRRDLDRIHNLHGQSIQSAEKARYYEAKAKTIEENTAISSDDPQALTKLREALKECEDLQIFMKEVNKCIKKKDKEGFLKLPGTSEAKWIVVNTPDCFNSKGFARYKLTNNGAEIRRLKKRIAQLEKLEKMETSESEYNGVIYRKNVEANRVQLIFPGKPAEEIRTILKKYGFRWAPSEKAWQRHLNNDGIFAANYALKAIVANSTLNKQEPAKVFTLLNKQDNIAA